jgi:holo-ACP synthase
MATLLSPISGNEMLAAREARAARQAAAMAQFGRPLVSITIAMPGPEKDGYLTVRPMMMALQEMDDLIHACNWPLISRQVFWPKTGPEAIYVVDVNAETLKSAAILLEERHPIGRLWDIDVITTAGVPLSRTEMGMPARRCMLCDRPAHECGRSRRHRLPELLKHIQNMVDGLDLHTRT